MISKFSRTIAFSAAITALFTSSALAIVGGIPTLKFVTPSEGQTLYGQKVPILVSVENFTVQDYQTNKNKVVGQGHIHLWLDDPNPTKESAVKLTKDEFTYSDVPYGDHTLKAEIVNNNHTSLTPPTVSVVNFKTTPVATPSPVATSGFDKNTALVILVVVALVILAAWWYTKEEEEETPKASGQRKPAKTARKRR